MKLLSSFIIILTLQSCSSGEKFDSKKWKIEGDLESYPFREEMVDDLIQSKILIGRNCKTVQEILGLPNSIEQKDYQIYYTIKVDYGWDIDPVYSKDLILKMNADSVITDVQVIEWDKFKEQ